MKQGAADEAGGEGLGGVWERNEEVGRGAPGSCRLFSCAGVARTGVAPSPSVAARARAFPSVPSLASVQGTLRPAVAGVVVARVALAPSDAAEDASAADALNGASKWEGRLAAASAAHPQHGQQ